MAEKDPFTKLCDAFWTLLEADTDFAAAVKSGNRIKYSSDDYDPFQHSAAPDDLPQVTVMYRGIRHHAREGAEISLNQNVSDGWLFRSLWSVEGRSRPHRVNEMGELQWVTMRALSKWRNTFLPLTWDSNTFVSCLTFRGTQSEIERSKVNQGITGWTTVMPVEVHMQFNNTGLPVT